MKKKRVWYCLIFIVIIVHLMNILETNVISSGHREFLTLVVLSVVIIYLVIYVLYIFSD